MREFLGADVRQEPFWNVVGRAGHRIGLFDVPKMPLSEGLNGIQIVDWGTHDSDIPACSWPADLIDEVSQKHGTSPFRRCDWVMDGPDPEQTLRRHLLWRADAKLAIADDLLQREPWDLFMIGFGESHCVGHQCWHVHDPSHPKHDPALASRIGDPVRDVYIALDSAVGRLLEYAGPETTVLVHCTHGMSAHYDATYLLDEVLRRSKGGRLLPPHDAGPCAQAVEETAGQDHRERRRTGARGQPAAGCRRSARAFVFRGADQREQRRHQAEPRRARTQRHAACGQRRRRVRRAFDRRSPGDHRSCRWPPVDQGGHSLPRRVSREHSDLLPDLFIRWNRDRPIAGVSSPKIGTIIEEDHSTRRTGDHRPGGCSSCAGPAFRLVCNCRRRRMKISRRRSRPASVSRYRT